MSIVKTGLIFLLGLVPYGSAIGKDAGILPVTELATLIADYPITVLGERHRRPESTQLVADLVDKFTGAGGCLAVALEIPSNQQPALDAAMTGKSPVADVFIHPIIDHPAFREMLEGFHNLSQAGRCLSVEAVDVPPGVAISRDHWMTDKIAELAKDQRVLTLMGNLHAIKRVQWESGIDDPFLAEHLERRGLQVLSVMQNWDEGCEQRTGRWLTIDHPRAAAAVRKTMSLAAVHQPETLEAVANGAVIWECQ
jgi:hypothetical protein